MSKLGDVEEYSVYMLEEITVNKHFCICNCFVNADFLFAFA